TSVMAMTAARSLRSGADHSAARRATTCGGDGKRDCSRKPNAPLGWAEERGSRSDQPGNPWALAVVRDRQPPRPVPVLRFVGDELIGREPDLVRDAGEGHA